MAIVIDGPVRLVENQTLVIYDFVLTLAADDPLLAVVRPGDRLRIQGVRGADTIQVISVVFIDVLVLIEGGQVWRGDDCAVARRTGPRPRQEPGIPGVYRLVHQRGVLAGQRAAPKAATLMLAAVEARAMTMTMTTMTMTTMMMMMIKAQSSTTPWFASHQGRPLKVARAFRRVSLVTPDDVRSSLLFRM
ncbi:MAG: hypothetical protein HC915_17860 [Anaerolineae bacterium]|nr:hypothetical protein [Anaerolineae bacterium]